MLDFAPLTSRSGLSEADRLAEPDAPWAMLARWIETQRQDVWGRAILGSDGDLSDPRNRFLVWMIGRKMDRANAIRLFWRLYRPELYLLPEDGAGARTSEDIAALTALRAILARFAVSGYPCGQLGIGRDEARYYRLRWREGLAGLKGRQPSGATAFAIPAEFFQPQPGRALEEAPTIRPVGPAPEWMGTETEVRFRDYGIFLRELVSGAPSRRFGAEMWQRLGTDRHRSRLIRGAASGITAIAAMVYVSGGDMGRLLHLLHVSVG